MAAPFQTPHPELSPPAWPRDRLEVRFESDEALERGLALAGTDAGVRVCDVDRRGRRLVLRLATARRPATRLLH